MIETRTLIAFEEQYRAYREFIGSAIQSHRPHVVVAVAGLDALQRVAVKLDRYTLSN